MGEQKRRVIYSGLPGDPESLFFLVRSKFYSAQEWASKSGLTNKAGPGRGDFGSEDLGLDSWLAVLVPFLFFVFGGYWERVFFLSA